MDYKNLADLLFPNITLTKDDLEKRYPKRNLKDGAIVTRFAPSPTGFLHIGSVFTCLVASDFANKTGGVFILRIEDTDQNRKLEGAVGLIIDGLKRYDIHFDEGVNPDITEFGNYGPYTQSKRKEIYMTMAKYLVSIGKAYPCFCNEDISSRDKHIQEINKELIGYYGQYAHCKNLSYEEIEQNLKDGKKFAIRLKCESSEDKKIIVEDSIRGTLKLSDNFKDVVILKSDFLPPYNFAHACDDHFMHVNLAVRGDEYLPSIAEHLQIFNALGFEPIQYAHVAPIQKMDGDSKRKISKRKDPEANVEFYMQQGYPVEAVREYLLTVANSNFEEWRKQNPDLPNNDFALALNKMSISGALFDLPKLNDVAKNVISKFSAQKVYDLTLAWAERYDNEFAKLLKENQDLSLRILSIERGTQKPRKDIAKWNEVQSFNSYFFNELFNPTSKDFYVFDEKFNAVDLKWILNEYAKQFEVTEDKQEWFNVIKHLATPIGFADDMKLYKENPENYKGNYGEVSSIIRMALTGRTNTPDLFEICKLLGKEEVVKRLNKCAEML